MLVPFWKVESVGNDFVLVHLEDVRALGDPEELLPELATQACERRFGVGSDGLLTVEPVKGGVQMRMFNPDGTEDFCGNGLRCAGLHSRRQGWVDRDFSLFHGGREIVAREERDGSFSTVIGVALYEPAEVPHTVGHELFDTEIYERFSGSSLTTGSTHTILLVSALPSDEVFEEVSARLETDARFPLRTSVIWTRVVSDDELEVRIWERGVGETLGCGTGASAAAADHLRRLGRGGSVRVRSCGGEILVSADAWDAPLKSRSFARELFSGEFRFRAKSIEVLGVAGFGGVGAGAPGDR